MLGGREPGAPSGIFKHIVDTLAVRFVDDVFEADRSNSPIPHSLFEFDDRPKTKANEQSLKKS